MLDPTMVSEIQGIHRLQPQGSVSSPALSTISNKLSHCAPDNLKLVCKKWKTIRKEYYKHYLQLLFLARCQLQFVLSRQIALVLGFFVCALRSYLSMASAVTVARSVLVFCDTGKYFCQ